MARDGKMDAHLDVCDDGYAGRLDEIAGSSGRRRRSDEDEARIVAESLMAGVSVADVARRHGLTHWQVYDWRRRVRGGRLALPERVSPAFAALVVDAGPPRPASAAGIEIVVGDVVIRAAPGVDEGHLSRVIRGVRAAI